MIDVTFPAPIVAAATDTATRTITGVAVPYGVPGRVSDGRSVIFERGSIDVSARPVALRDHDRSRPIGVVASAADRGPMLEASIRVSATRDGDEALVLAGDGALPMMSVGADPVDYTIDADGTLRITAATWLELSLLTLGAYDTARVTHVAASLPDIGEPDMTITDTTPPVVDPDDAPVVDPDAPPADPADDDDDAPVVEGAAGAVPITAARGAGGRGRPNPYAGLTLHRLAQVLGQARRGDAGAARYVAAALAAQSPVEAALVDVTLVGANNVGVMQRPGYQAELVELISWGTPMIDALRQGDLERGDYPSKSFNRWTLAPTVGLQATEKSEIVSTPVKIDPVTVPVQTWAGGNDISQQTLDLGSPSFVEDYIRAAAIDYAKKSDTYACTTLLAAATDVLSVADATFIEIVQGLISALSPATTPPGGLFLATSWDVAAGLIGVPRDEGPAFWDGSVSFGSFTPTAEVGGLSAFVDPNLPARTYLLGHRQGATWYDVPGTPFNLRAVNVAQLGLDVALYGYGALGVQYPGAFAKTTQPAA